MFFFKFFGLNISLIRDLLTAHEHQLSDIAEACKKEMNLLSCLKDNQVVSFVNFLKNKIKIN